MQIISANKTYNMDTNENTSNDKSTGVSGNALPISSPQRKPSYPTSSIQVGKGVQMSSKSGAVKRVNVATPVANEDASGSSGWFRSSYGNTR